MGPSLGSGSFVKTNDLKSGLPKKVFSEVFLCISDMQILDTDYYIEGQILKNYNLVYVSLFLYSYFCFKADQTDLKIPSCFKAILNLLSAKK